MLLNIHTMECYLVIRNKQTSDICNNTDESKTIKLMKTNHKQKRIYSMIPFVWESRKDYIYSNRELISDCPGPGSRNWLQRSKKRLLEWWKGFISFVTTDLFKKIRDTKGTVHAKMGTIKDRNGRNLTEAEDIKKRW